MARRRHQKNTDAIAIEICPSKIHFARLSRRSPDAPVVVSTRSITWRREAASLHTEAGTREFAGALRTLVAEERLSGQTLWVALNSDYCVTRVVTGTESWVRREMAHLEERSALYLSLGQGAKALAGSVRQIDARHQHALLSVANKKVLDTIVAVAEETGLELDLIEPSLVALSRCVGHMRQDAEAPLLIITLTEGGVELGISYDGQLILDYRPGGRTAKEEIATTITTHLARLQRYCMRYYRYAEGHIDRALLCGEGEAIAQVKQGFDRLDKISVETLLPDQIDAQWQFDTDHRPGGELSPAIGTALRALDNETEHTGPNLMERFRMEKREPLLPALAKTCWPLAAVLLVAVGVFALVASERRDCAAIQQQIDQYATEKARGRRLEAEMRHTNATVGHLTAVGHALANPAWQTAIEVVGHCMPEDDWLEKFTADADGKITISGMSYSDDAIDEFVGWLRQAPGFSGVALEGTTTSRRTSTRQVNFLVHCEFADQARDQGDGENDH